MKKIVLVLSAIVFSQLAHAENYDQMFCNATHGYVVSLDTDKNELKRKTKDLFTGEFSEESIYEMESFDETTEEEYKQLEALITDSEDGMTINYRSSIKQKLVITYSVFTGETLYSLDRWTNTFKKIGTALGCRKKVECSSYSNDSTIMEALNYVGTLYPADVKFCQPEDEVSIGHNFSLQVAEYEDVLMSNNQPLTHVKVIVNEFTGDCRRRVIYIKPARFPGDSVNRVTTQFCSNDY